MQASSSTGACAGILPTIRCPLHRFIPVLESRSLEAQKWIGADCTPIMHAEDGCGKIAVGQSRGAGALVSPAASIPAALQVGMGGARQMNNTREGGTNPPSSLETAEGEHAPEPFVPQNGGRVIKRPTVSRLASPASPPFTTNVGGTRVALG